MLSRFPQLFFALILNFQFSQYLLECLLFQVTLLTKVLACQVVGMTKQAAVDYLEAEGRTVRIASEDGEYFALTEDYRDDRVNLDILVGLVVGANAW